jgi:large subunit ribosomal protein L24
MNKLRINDEVIILAGKDSGKTGKVLNVNRKTNRVLVEGINQVKKALRPTQENPQGGIIDVERPLHLSNVALKDPKTGRATRVRIETKDNKKVRVAVKSGTVL